MLEQDKQSTKHSDLVEDAFYQEVRLDLERERVILYRSVVVILALTLLLQLRHLMLYW